MRVELSGRAKHDLMAIAAYYAEVGGKALAARMAKTIKFEVLALANTPELGPRYELAPSVRRLVIAKGAFQAFYRIADNVQVVHIRRAEREPIEHAP